MVTIAIPWLVMDRFDSPKVAGLVLAAASLSPLLITPFSGWLIDHLGRRRVSIGADVLSALSVSAIPVVALLIGLTPATVFALALLGALFDPAGYTARKALLTDTARVTGTGQRRLNGIHDGVFGIAWVAGPALGAWLIAGFGVVSPFWCAALLFAVSAGCITLLRVDSESQSTTGESGLLLGFTVLWQDRVLRTLTIALVTIAMIYLPTESIVLTAYFEQQGDPRSFGVVISALSAGATVGALGFGWLSEHLSSSRLLRMIMAGTASSIIPMAFLPSLPWLTAAAFCLGFFWGPLNPLVTTLVQQRVPAEQRGRVYSAQISVLYAGPPLGMLATGHAVERWGVADAYLALAIVLVVTAIVVLRAKSLRQGL